jgi:transposase
VKEAKVASDPDALVAWFKEVGLAMVRIGLEAGPRARPASTSLATWFPLRRDARSGR